MVFGTAGREYVNPVYSLAIHSRVCGISSRKVASTTLVILTLASALSASPGRPAYANGVSEVKYFVALFDFQDLNHTKSYEEIKKIAIDEVQQYWDEVSYGKLRVIADIAPKWITLPITVKNRDVFQWNFNSKDMSYVDNIALDIFKQLLGSSIYSITFMVFAGKVWGHAYSSLKLTVLNENHVAGTYSHELGHVLGLPDLYSYIASQQGQYSGANVGYWDLMSASVHSHLCSWSKIELKLFEKEQVVDVKGKLEGTYTIDPIEVKGGKTLVARVSISETQAYLIEVRERIGFDAKLDKRMRMGVLIFHLNDVLDAREGKLKVIDSHPNSYNPTTPWAELFDAPFNVGSNETAAFINRERNLSVIVLSKVGNSYKITLSDAAAGDRAIEANGILTQAEDAIRKAEKENRLKGLDEAKNELDKAKSAYGEAQFENTIMIAKRIVTLANSATQAPVTATTAATGITKSEITARTEATPTPLSQEIMLPLAIAVIALIAIGATIAVRKSKKTA
nr:hypothetical protein [Candidatus Njordarchaeum guaymaensis]